MPKGPDGKCYGVDVAEALATEKGEPVKGFPIRYEWHTGPCREFFDSQIRLIKRDVRRARAEDKLIVYLSCPISARGGGSSGTNVDLAKFTERALLQRWAENFWTLNPAQYQLESKAGTRLMEQHAQDLNLNLDNLRAISNPLGAAQRTEYDGGDCGHEQRATEIGWLLAR
jgi:hypothetical protein